MKRYLLRVLVGISVACAGCIVNKDVTESAEYQGGYKKGDKYRIVSEVAMSEFGFLSAAPARVSYARSGVSVKEGLLETGTLVRVVRIMYRQHPENGTSLHPMAIIESGKWRGRLVDLVFISQNGREVGEDPYRVFALEPDPSYLRISQP